MRRRSVLEMAAGLAAGSFLRPAFGQIAPQLTLTCNAAYRGRPKGVAGLGEESLWFDEPTVTAREREALVQSRALRARPVPFQQVRPGLNVILTYGQSNAFGTQAHPSLPLPNITGLWMLGASHRGTGAAEIHDPIGNMLLSAMTLNPLASTTLNKGRTYVLSYREAAELSANPSCDVDPGTSIDNTCQNGNGGESIGVVFTAYLRQRIIELRGADQGDLVLVDCSEPQQTIASLDGDWSRQTPPRGPDFSKRIPSAFEKIRKAAPSGTPVRHIATLFVQGSEDYGVGTSEADYVRGLERCFNDIDQAARTKFVRMGVSDQEAPAVGIIMQTSGRGVTGSSRYDLSISLAQTRFARARNYPISQEVGLEHGIHFTNNGARMAALSAARGAEDVLLGRQNHIDIAPVQTRLGVDLGPTRGTAGSNELLIPFTAPGPLCFVPIIQGTPATLQMPNVPPYKLTMISSGTTETYGIVVQDGVPDPVTDIKPIKPIEKLFWVSDRVLCVRATRPWQGEVTVGCGYRIQAVGRTNISTLEQRGSSYRYIYLPPNAGLDHRRLQ